MRDAGLRGNPPKSASAPLNPIEGDWYYNTVDNSVYLFDGTSWNSIAGAPGAPATFFTGHTWGVIGPLSASTSIPEFYVPIASGQGAKVAAYRARIGSGTSIDTNLLRNGISISTATITSTTSGGALDVTLAPNDTLDLALSNPVGSPVDISFTVVLKHSWQAAEGTINNFIQDTAPSNPPPTYTWWQTGLGPDGEGFTLWIEDGAA